MEDLINEKQTVHKKRRWLWLLITVCTLVLYLAVSTIIVDTIYTELCFNNHFDYESTADPIDYDLDVFEHRLTAEDGLQIHTYEVRIDDPSGVVIMLTGITGPSVTYFYGEAQLVAEMGFASILVDARGHGQSDGDKITLAIDDVKDVNVVVDYIKSDARYKDKPIVVMGLSMGGATAINAGSLNKDIDGIIALSPFSSWPEVCLDMVEQHGYPRWLGKILLPGIYLHGFLNYGWDFFAITPNQTIQQVGDRPILIMRSLHDAIVPIENHKRLIEKYNGANLTVFIRDAEEHHVVKDDNISCPFNDEEYCWAILNFLDQFTPVPISSIKIPETTTTIE